MTEEEFKLAEAIHNRLRNLENMKSKLSRHIHFDTITFSDSIGQSTETIAVNPEVVAEVRRELLKLVEKEIKKVKSDFEKL